LKTAQNPQTDFELRVLTAESPSKLAYFLSPIFNSSFGTSPVAASPANYGRTALPAQIAPLAWATRLPYSKTSQITGFKFAILKHYPF